MRRLFRFFPTALLIAAFLPLSGMAAPIKANAVKQQHVSEPIHTAEIVVGPFDLHRRYRSMEGPYAAQQFRIGDLLASKRAILPESTIIFVEGNTSGSGPSMGGPSMDSAGAAQSTLPQGLTDTSGQKRELYWFKGMKIEVLDENDKPLPTAEFICHLNLDVDPAFRNKIFTEGERNHNARLVTLTQGQTAISFPDGFAVPVASDEKWNLTFQAANRTSDAHRRLKHRCYMYFVKDSELMYPLKALSWYAPYISVVVDRDSPEAAETEHKGHPDCLVTSVGVTAPNSVPGALITDSLKRRLSGHWVVPPGTHSYTSPITEERDAGLTSKDRIIHFAWSHIHPLCSTISLKQCGSPEDILTVHAKTNVAKGLEIEKIEPISSKQGIKLPAGKNYELIATYDNVTETPLDSMAVLGLFYEDNTFARPDWFLSNQNEAFCGVSGSCPRLTVTDKGVSVVSTQSTSAAPISPTAYVPPYPIFDAKYDGPLLQERKFIELETSAGNLHLELIPSLAPMHVTQLYKLFKNGVFDGTPIYRYEANFVLQLANVERKADGKPALTSEMRNMLRRLPLEVESQQSGSMLHKKWMLSMARYDDKDTAVSSFSIMLGNAPHLDKQYTLFGQLVDDDTTRQTMNRIISAWGPVNPFVIGVRDFTSPVAGRP